MKCLQRYKVVTHDHQSNLSEPNPLFLSYIRPFKLVTSQRIAHWIENLQKEAGINTDIFKPNSARGPSATAALNKGVSLAEILSMADCIGAGTLLSESSTIDLLSLPTMLRLYSKYTNIVSAEIIAINLPSVKGLICTLRWIGLPCLQCLFNKSSCDLCSVTSDQWQFTTHEFLS